MVIWGYLGLPMEDRRAMKLPRIVVQLHIDVPHTTETHQLDGSMGDDEDKRMILAQPESKYRTHM